MAPGPRNDDTWAARKRAAKGNHDSSGGNWCHKKEQEDIGHVHRKNICKGRRPRRGNKLGTTNLPEDEGIDFDLDSCDRIMCDEDDAGTILNLLEENGIDADLI